MAKDKKNNLDESGKEFKSFADELNDSLSKVNENIIKMHKSLGTDVFSDMTDDINDVNDAIDEGLKKYGNSFKNLATSQYAMVAAMKEMNNVSLKGNEIAIKAQDRYLDIFDSALSFLDKIPGGGILADALGLDFVKTQLKSQLQNIFSTVNKTGTISFSQLQKAFSTTLSSIISTLGGAIKLVLTNPIFLLVAGVAVLTKMFFNLQNAVKGFREETGLVASQLTKLEPKVENIALSTRTFGVTLEDAFGAATSIYTQFKNIKEISPSLVKTSVLLLKNYGIATDTSAEMFLIFKSIQGTTNKMLGNISGSIIQASKLAGVAPKEVFEDIANNSEFIFTYLKGSSTEIVKAAIGARRLGLELGQVEKITENLMDFNSSIENTMMASLLVNKNLNFMKARQLIFEGNIDDAMKNVYNQVKSIGEFDKLNFVQKKAIADAIGLSVGELSKSLTVQKLVGNMNERELATYNSAIDSIKERNKLTKTQLILQKEQQVATQQIKDAFMGLISTVGRIFLPILNAITPILVGIANFVTGINVGVDGTITKSKQWWSTLKAVGVVIGTLVVGMLALKVISLALSKIPIFGTGGGGILSKLGRGFTSFAKGLQPLVAPKVVLGLAIFVATMIGLGYAFKLAEKGIKAAGTAIAEIITSVGDALVKIGGVGPGILITAAALYSIIPALTAFTAVAAGGGLLNAIGLGGNNVASQLKELSDLGPGLNSTAKGIQNITSALGNYNKAAGNFETIDLPDNVTTINNGIEDKLDKIISIWENIKFDVNLDGKKVGTGIGKTIYASQIG